MSRWIAGYTFVCLFVFGWNVSQLPCDPASLNHFAGWAVLLFALPTATAGFTSAWRNFRRPLRLFDRRTSSGFSAAARGITAGLATFIAAAAMVLVLERTLPWRLSVAPGTDCTVMILSAFLGARAGLLFARPIRPGRCVRCDYDLRMSIEYGRCPECGTSI